MKISVLIIALLTTIRTYSQELVPGNLIPDYGKTFPVESPGFKTDTSSVLKVVFDVDRQFKFSQPNALIETAARYLNMHEKAGVAPENMKVALVIHGKAVLDVLQNEAYRREHPEASRNHNLDLIKTLSNNGVEIIVCGQSAAYHKVSRTNASERVKFALSAMTALIQLQNDGYQLIKF